MEEKYKAWIREHVKDDGYAQCAEKTLEMQHAFPELSRKRGMYDCPFIGERTHWWLTTPDGEIVDPTAKQFPSMGVTGTYREIVKDEDCPSGVCRDCGNWVYGGRDFCSDECQETYMRYLNRARHGGGY